MLSIVHVPEVVIYRVQKRFFDFFWGASNVNRKRKWILWAHIYKPFDEGGLVVRNLANIQSALLIKLAW